MLMEPIMLTGSPEVGAVRANRQLLAGWRGVMCVDIERWTKIQEQLNLF